MRELNDALVIIDEARDIETARRAEQAAAIFLQQSIKRVLYADQVACAPAGNPKPEKRTTWWWRTRLLIWAVENLQFRRCFVIKVERNPDTLVTAVRARTKYGDNTWFYSEHDRAKDRQSFAGFISNGQAGQEFETRATASYIRYIARQVLA